MILYIHQHNYIKMIQYCSIIRGFRKGLSVLCIFKMGFRWCEASEVYREEKKKPCHNLYFPNRSLKL